MKKNYDNKNILKYKNKYINMKWKRTLSFYTTNLSKLGQWDKPGSHWRHVYEWNVNRYLSYESTANWFAQNARTTTVAIAAVPQVKKHKSTSKN